jgi:phosphoribosylformimino-5-aminoimidazole carboxamide ribotide isomerase
MIIFPAMDILSNQVVRLKKGDYAQVKVYHVDAVAQAQAFEKQGATWLHVVDLDGARLGTFTLLPLIQSIQASTQLRIQCGGGIRSRETIERLLQSGIDRIVIGSFALTHLDIIESLCQRYAERIVIAVDSHDGKVAYQGWTQTSTLTITNFINQLSLIGVKHIMVTDIRHDGMLTGVDQTLYTSLCQQFPSIHFIASGGVASLDDIRQLKHTSVSGVIIGVALYEQRFSLSEVLSC